MIVTIKELFDLLPLEEDIMFMIDGEEAVSIPEKDFDRIRVNHISSTSFIKPTGETKRLYTRAYGYNKEPDLSNTKTYEIESCVVIDCSYITKGEE